MSLEIDQTENIAADRESQAIELTIVFKEHNDDGETYVVAECLEIPGCITQGSTEDEARSNMHDALELCLSVMFEDSLRLAMSGHRAQDLRGITSQSRVNVTAAPHLQYA